MSDRGLSTACPSPVATRHALGDGGTGAVAEPLRVGSIGLRSHVVLSVTGELDMATAPILAEALQVQLHAVPPRTEIVVDVAAATFVDARGLATMLEAGQTARHLGTHFRVIDRARHLDRLLEITGATDALGAG